MENKRLIAHAMELLKAKSISDLQRKMDGAGYYWSPDDLRKQYAAEEEEDQAVSWKLEKLLKGAIHHFTVLLPELDGLRKDNSELRRENERLRGSKKRTSHLKEALDSKTEQYDDSKT